ncbi:PREDICTED: uncharacterized protein LOC104817097 [Tarenaya hassleriana]|uniref:uncharacterized protein LOC104817097 n=1 Tax=Tarenaya hassleriana TaxID=28532 RepID=UPI00053C594B|nr:PREDICTED: uncharacterized protein LOC104817097 [Tarenaya hassleriana]
MDSQPKLIPITLNGDNYFYWTKAATAVLTSKGLWAHVSTKRMPPTPQMATGEDNPVEVENRNKKAADEYAQWKQLDSQALVLLQGSLDSTILQSFISNDTAMSLWESLKQTYGNLSNISRIFELKKKLFNLQQNGQPFNKIQGELSALWAELEEIRPTSTDAPTVMTRAQEDKVFSILLTLDPSFNDLIYHLLRQSSLPSYEEVCMMIKREEGGRNLFTGPLELAHFTKKPSFTLRDRKSFFCDHCKHSGHTKDRCWVSNPHLKPSRYKDTPRREAAMTAGHEPVPNESSINLTSAELKGLKHLLQTFNQDSGNITTSLSIVIDSGATTHMFRDASWFTNITTSNGVVSVANGKSVPILGHGTISLFDTKLTALYVPQFQTNLLSIPKLIAGY